MLILKYIVNTKLIMIIIVIMIKKVIQCIAQLNKEIMFKIVKKSKSYIRAKQKKN